MSRCYPYLRNGEAVSETIKTDLNKLKKKDKKEKRSKIEQKKSTSLSKLEKSLLKRKDDDEAERSSLTEEHGRPICHQGLSSDSARSRNKRKSDDVVHSASNATENNGNVIRVIPFESCSDAGSEKREKSSRHHVSGAEKKLLKAEALYETLFADWTAPPVVYDQNNFDDQSWLSGTKMQDICRGKRTKVYQHDNEPGHEASSFWPCARNLPQADIYALPYTLSF
ncbi:uncharacterized protein LOC126681374 [Mercurialis annua]|uniref:uncharacterized protein LOC126681374 n=1 Tax=Mercurialis annua TaxID=3986 RepID=UPI00215E7EAA|nr:uncharacterized protein LOC126681374 [Mercurialis annua]